MAERLRIPFYQPRPLERSYELERDWWEIERVINGLSTGAGGDPFDGVVDASFTASDPANRNFKGIAEAIAYLTNTVGLTRASLYVRPGLYTETANWNSPTGAVTLFGGGDPLGNQNTYSATWNPGVYGPNGRGTGVYTFYNMNLQFGQFDTFTTNGSLVAHNCYFDFRFGLAPAGWVFGPTVWLDNCIIEHLPKFASTQLLMSQCFLYMDFSRDVTLGTQWVTRGCNIYVDRTATVVFRGGDMVDIEFYGMTDSRLVSAATQGTPQLVMSGPICHIKWTGNKCVPDLQAASTYIQNVNIQGQFFHLDVAGTGIVNAHAWNLNPPHILNGAPPSTGATTGGLLVSVTTNNRVNIQGDNVTGAIHSSMGQQNAGTALNFVGARNCNLVATVANPGGTAVPVPYAFDSNSHDNILLVTGLRDFSVSGTDAGARNTVLPGGFLATEKWTSPFPMVPAPSLVSADKWSVSNG